MYHQEIIYRDDDKTVIGCGCSSAAAEWLEWSASRGSGRRKVIAISIIHNIVKNELIFANSMKIKLQQGPCRAFERFDSKDIR